MIRHSMHIQKDMFGTLWFVHSVEKMNFDSVRAQNIPAKKKK